MKKYLSTGFTPELADSELIFLRKSVYEKYRELNGITSFVKLNSTRKNYEKLIQDIENEIDLKKEELDIELLEKNSSLNYSYPGDTFYRRLFFFSKRNGYKSFVSGNIDLCYFFCFNTIREEFLMQNKSLSKTFIGHSTSNDKEVKPLSFIISHSYKDSKEAEVIEEHIKEKIDVRVALDIRNSKGFNYKKRNLEELYLSLSEDSFVLLLLSRDFLKSENCLLELIDFSQKNLDIYLEKTIILLLPDLYHEDEYNIFSGLGRFEISRFWNRQFEKVELEIAEIRKNQKITNGKEKNFIEFLSELKLKYQTAAKQIMELLEDITSSDRTIRYEVFQKRITDLDTLYEILPKPIIPDLSYEKIYENIIIPSENNPLFPVFPPKPFYTPSFPTSNPETISYKNYRLLIKSESNNPTGTHKDRLAWEIIAKYKEIIKKYKKGIVHKIPSISIISSGSAAIAIQNMFNLYEIPKKLKVLTSNNTRTDILEILNKIGCEVYPCDLNQKEYKPTDIKKETDNYNGIDITYRETLDHNLDKYYDWMSYEIINQNPDYCFIPFGTGDLYINILNIVRREFNSMIEGKTHDPRFYGDINKITKCHFHGATTRDPNTKADKLFSSFLPALNDYYKYIKRLKNDHKCIGLNSNIYHIDADYLDKAIQFAKENSIVCEASGIAGLALFFQKEHTIPTSSKVLIVNTGKTKKWEEIKDFYDQNEIKY